jgi:DNA-binding MarR family transcriptional regulator
MPRRSTRIGPGGGSVPTEADQLWDALREDHRRLRAELRQVLQRRGIYPSEYRALGRLVEQPRSMGNLAEELGLTPASVTDLTRQLEQRGWILRRRSTSDRRVYMLSITPKGRQTHRASRAEYAERLAEIEAALPPEARDELDRGLEALRTVLVARSRPIDDPES